MSLAKKRLKKTVTTGGPSKQKGSVSKSKTKPKSKSKSKSKPNILRTGQPLITTVPQSPFIELTEILFFWASQVSQPTTKLLDPVKWALANPQYEVENGKAGLYFAFCQFRRQRKDFLYPPPPAKSPEEQKEDEEDIDEEAVAIAEAIADAKIPECDRAVLDPLLGLTENRFWSRSRDLLPGIKVVNRTGSVLLPLRRYCEQLLMRYPKDMANAVRPLHVSLINFPHHPLDNNKGKEEEEETGCYPMEGCETHTVVYDTDENPVNIVISSDAELDEHNPDASRFEYTNLKRATPTPSWISIGDAGRLHPMFNQVFWKRMLAMLVCLAFEEQIFIRFNVGIGQKCQYVMIYDDSYIMKPSDVLSKDNGVHNGALFCQLEMAQFTPNMWSYEFDQDMRGMDREDGVKVKLVFRRDCSNYFMPLIG